MPKRKGFIIEQVADMDNLRAADKEAQAKGKAKRNRYIRRHNMRAEEDLQELQRMILEEDWPEVVYSKLVVHNEVERTEILRDSTSIHGRSYSMQSFE